MLDEMDHTIVQMLQMSVIFKKLSHFVKITE